MSKILGTPWEKDVARHLAGAVGARACAEAGGTLENLIELIESLEDGASEDDTIDERLRDLGSVARILLIAAQYVTAWEVAP